MHTVTRCNLRSSKFTQKPLYLTQTCAGRVAATTQKKLAEKFPSPEPRISQHVHVNQKMAHELSAHPKFSTISVPLWAVPVVGAGRARRSRSIRCGRSGSVSKADFRASSCGRAGYPTQWLTRLRRRPTSCRGTPVEPPGTTLVVRVLNSSKSTSPRTPARLTGFRRSQTSLKTVVELSHEPLEPVRLGFVGQYLRL
jgi:hypothetical protein